MSAEKILIVEDEAIVAADIADSLTSLGYQVCGKCSSGEDAVKKAHELRPDAVLMDIKLKGKTDGIQAALDIRSTLQIPVIYLTAHADESTLARAKVTEPYGYILKPFEEIELRIALELALHKRRLEHHPKTAPDTVAPSLSPLSQLTSQLQDMGETGVKDKLALSKFLGQIAPFSGLPESGIAMLVDGCQRKTFAAGSLIAFEGDGGVDGFIVLKGRISLLKTSPSGRELIVELLPPGDVFGLIAALDKQTYPFTVRAQAESEILSLPKSLIVRLIDQYPALYRSFIDVIATRLRTSHEFSRALAHDRVEVRVASTLQALIPRFQSATGAPDRPQIAITRQELADLTGTTVETAIRVTKHMEREGILDLSHSGNITVLHPTQLESIAGSAE